MENKRGMLGKTVLAVVLVVLLVAVVVSARNWGYARYGTVYNYGEPYYTYYPMYVYPLGTLGTDREYHDWHYGPYYGNAPEFGYAYPSKAGVNYPYRSGMPTTVYNVPEVPRGTEGQLCGSLSGAQYGCVYGLLCDYTKTGVTGVGVCSTTVQTTTYPYQVGGGSTYYYG